MAKNKASSAALWVVIGLLILGLVGFGAADFGGSVRAVAEVGDTEVDTDAYARNLQAQIRGFQQQTGQALSFQEARQFGFDRIALSQLISDAALRNQTKQLGLSIGDENVSREITNTPAFRGISGNFDRETYELALQQNGLTVRDFEAQVRDNVSTDLLRRAVVAGTGTPGIFTDTLFNYAQETRNVSWVRLTGEELAEPIAEPSEQDLSTFHAENPAPFTRPETRVVDYAWLTPSMIVDDIEVSDEQLRPIYESRLNFYQQPERRLVERLIYSNQTDADAAKARLDAGEVTFDDLVAERGLELSDVDLGDVTQEDLADAGEDVFALADPGVVGPLPSALGPALFRMNAVLAAQEISFDEARDDLADEAALDRARRIINDQIGQVEDLLAGGADMSILAERTDMQAGAIDWNEEVDSDIAAYDAFRRAAAAANPGDFPEVLQLADGGIFALTVTEVIAPELRPLEDVRDAVVDAWVASETGAALAAQAETTAEQLRTGETWDALGLTPNTDEDIGRTSFIEGTPPEFLEGVFEMASGDVSVIGGEGEAWLLRLDAIVPPDPNTPDAAQARELFADQATGEFANAIVSAFTQAVLEETGVTVNQSALNAVHAHLQ